MNALSGFDSVIENYDNVWFIMNFDVRQKNKRIVEPFLQFDSTSIYNPITDLTIKEGDH